MAPALVAFRVELVIPLEVTGIRLPRRSPAVIMARSVLKCTVRSSLRVLKLGASAILADAAGRAAAARRRCLSW